MSSITRRDITRLIETNLRRVGTNSCLYRLRVGDVIAYIRREKTSKWTLLLGRADSPVITRVHAYRDWTWLTSIVLPRALEIMLFGSLSRSFNAEHLREIPPELLQPSAKPPSVRIRLNRSA